MRSVADAMSAKTAVTFITPPHLCGKSLAEGGTRRCPPEFLVTTPRCAPQLWVRAADAVMQSMAQKTHA